MKKVVSTKKLSAADCARFEAAGWQVEHHAFIGFDYLSPAQNWVLDQQTALVFTSENGVIGAQNAYPELFTQKNTPVFCLSGKTRQTVEAHGQNLIVGVADNAPDLAYRILAHSHFRQVLFFNGTLSRSELPHILTQNGVKVVPITVYDTRLTPHTLDSVPDAILFFSPSAIDSFLQKNKLAARTRCFCIGQTTGSHLRRYTEQPIVCAPTPSVSALIEAVLTHIEP